MDCSYCMHCRTILADKNKGQALYIRKPEGYQFFGLNENLGAKRFFWCSLNMWVVGLSRDGKKLKCTLYEFGKWLAKPKQKKIFKQCQFKDLETTGGNKNE